MWKSLSSITRSGWDDNILTNSSDFSQLLNKPGIIFSVYKW